MIIACRRLWFINKNNRVNYKIFIIENWFHIPHQNISESMEQESLIKGALPKSDFWGCQMAIQGEPWKINIRKIL